MIIKNILNIYALLVCLITIIILIINCSFVLNSLTSLIIPQYKYAAALRQYESNEKFIEYKENSFSTQDSKLALQLKNFSSSQLDQTRIFEKEKFLAEKKAANIVDLIMTMQWILVASLFFYLHWRLYKRSKE